MSKRPLVLLAHGSRRPGPSSVLSRTAERVGTILPGVEVRTGYVELQPPDPATALEGLVDPVVLPFFLARGYHVLNDVPAAVERHGSGTVTGHLGVEEHLVEAVTQRLHEASASLGGIAGLDHIVLGAAGSRQAAALEEAEAITDAAERLAFLQERPDREDIRMVVGVLRGGQSWCVLRSRSHDDDASLYQGERLVPGLVEALESTFL